MKYYFFINPAAGQGGMREVLVSEIRKASEETGIPARVMETRRPGDGELLAVKTANSLHGEPARFFACGGDGTAYEIINGIDGFDNIELGIVPVGSGNDSIRNFGLPEKAFRDIRAQLLGDTQSVDLIRFHGLINGVKQNRLFLNMINIGFDCHVVATAAELKKKPFLSGSSAYMAAIMKNFIGKRGADLTLMADGKVISDEPVLLCSIANGSYCGGGLQTVPEATMDDGLFDVIVLKNIKRRDFIKLFPPFIKGKLTADNIGRENVLEHYRLNNLEVLPRNTKEFQFCADGEVRMTTGLSMKLEEKALKLVLPKWDDAKK